MRIGVLVVKLIVQTIGWYAGESDYRDLLRSQTGQSKSPEVSWSAQQFR